MVEGRTRRDGIAFSWLFRAIRAETLMLVGADAEAGQKEPK
jgi:hypothetical protein